MPRVRLSSLSSLAAVTLAASLVLAGCGADDDEPDAAPPPPAPTRTTPPADRAEATGSATPEQSAEPSSSPARKPGRHKVGTLQPRMRLETAAHLLDADGLPPLGDADWSVGATGPEDPDQDTVVGACQKTLLGTIGAVETVRRTFTAPGRLEATQVVARFADSRSAWRAHEVLAAWRADCAERVGGDVGPLEPLDVHAGTGESYRMAARKRASGLGILRAGSFVTLIEIKAGSDRYPTGWDPARVAVRRVARTF